MPEYQFEAMNAVGEEIRDKIHAPSEADAQTSIRQLGYFVTKISEVGKPAEPNAAQTITVPVVVYMWLFGLAALAILCIAIGNHRNKLITEAEEAEAVQAEKAAEQPKIQSRRWHGNGPLPADFYIPADSTGEYTVYIQSDKGADRREWRHIYEITSRDPLKFTDPVSGKTVEILPLSGTSHAVLEFKKHSQEIMERLQKGEKVLHPDSYDSSEDLTPPAPPTISEPF